MRKILFSFLLVHCSPSAGHTRLGITRYQIKIKNLLNSLRGLLDGEIALDLGLVDPVDGDPGEVATHHHRPQGVPLPGVRVKVENL
jgi:hypothetical protein